ncbi:TFIIH/NER complex subunit TFB2 [Ascoidea rubescens DSM 1968]|uniref:RNA polymerase II transcription factor B subunit 2 n=1 Tax=Ascoidea rubescens DSM 1968 TaxID=1344418 RepID=A0A1D2VS49_9ASCO|nr:RNA polymerase II transcription factor B subunit 2 [Ascoidea rubescens DSM 1968]ODV64385.1 RNA polymerase II transcription factor B subunit 2 [Ascoidea rubescens DSM 1968]
MSSYLFKDAVFQYLIDLPQSMKFKLFESPATCLAIYRLLPTLAKFYIMSMVFNEKKIILKNFDNWIKPDPLNKKIKNESLQKLLDLNLIETEHNNLIIKINSIFRQNFRNALIGENSISLQSNKITVDFLDNYATNKWESTLHFMVGTKLISNPSKGTIKLLESSGIMEVIDEHNSNDTLLPDNFSATNLKITKKGFQFLLQNVNTQIWTLLLQYLKIAETLQMDRVDVLNFIFMLGSLELGQSYSLTSLSDTQINMLRDLRDYGLVYQKNSKSKRFYPTRLATTLTSDTIALKSASTAMDQALKSNNKDNKNSATNLDTSSNTASINGSIIIETNFKLYCYTTSPLQIAILNLFVHLKQRFQNMVTGQITKKSIDYALKSGISSDQIIKYLEINAHPQMKKLAQEELNKKLELIANKVIASASQELQIIPPNVVDQIRLWELELDRIQSSIGYLFKDFSSIQQYLAIKKYSDEIGVLLWSHDNSRRLFVTSEGKQQIADYMMRRSNKASNRERPK